jgi:general secretion pathway protein I
MENVNFQSSRRRRRGRRGFSLLEVILALAILTGAIAVLGELARQGIESTRIARDTSRALLLCENKLAEITSGLVDPEQMYDVPCDQAADGSLAGLQTQLSSWLYSVELASLDVPGLVAVRVSVYQNLPPETEPVECSLVRWIVDPGVEFYVPEEEASATETAQPTE